MTRWNGWAWGRRHWPTGVDGNRLYLAAIERDRAQHRNQRCPICGLVMEAPRWCRDCSRFVCTRCYRWDGPACVECLDEPIQEAATR